MMRDLPLAFGRFVFNTLQWAVGVRINRQNLNTSNSFDAIMIILATYFIFPFYSGYVDVFSHAVGDNVLAKMAVESFRYSFLVSSAWLILIALFSEVKFEIVKLFLLVIPGLVLGLVLTYLLTLFTGFFQGVAKLDDITLFIVIFYPIIFSYFVRFKINQKMKTKPPAPDTAEINRLLYQE